jgi:ketosteroid isomerase-like protein
VVIDLLPLKIFSNQGNLSMKRILLIVLLSVALSTFAFGQKRTTNAKPGKTSQTATTKSQPGANRVQEQLKKLEEEWAQAFIKRDGATLNRLLADDYIVIDPNGEVGDKASMIADITSGEVVFESIKYENLKVRVYGSFAIVTGGEIVQMNEGDKSSTSGLRFTDVFALRGGRWQAVSSQFVAARDVGLSVVTRADGSKETTTISGLKYIDLVEGKGASPKPGQMAIVNYTGTLENGTKFDSSFDRGQPLTFPIGVGRVIKGWDEGIISMKIGGKRKLFIPANLAYGAAGRPPVIPPNAPLIFEVELVGVR